MRRVWVWLAPVWAFAAWAGACSASIRAPRFVDTTPNAGAATLQKNEAIAPAPAPTTTSSSPIAIALPTQAIETPTRYPFDAMHSPMTASVIARVRSILANGYGRRDWIAKVGDSHTASPSFLECFTNKDVRLGDHEALAPTIDFFHGWARDSLAAKSGWHAVQTLGAPLHDEIAETRPGFAIVMLGTNDTNQTPEDEFERYLEQNVDTLLRAGVVPILQTIPARGDSDDAEALVPEMNTIIRAVAQARQVPYVDLHASLAELPDGGLAGDGIHLQVHVQSGWHGCWLTEEGLGAGMNRRNLVTLESFDRLRRFVIEDQVPEAAPAALQGDGTFAAPLLVDAIPFADDRDTTRFASAVEGYSCARRALDGGEVVYEITLAEETRLRVRLFADPGVDLDLHWLDGDEAGHCTSRADRALEVTASAGRHRVVVDGPAAKSGKYRLTIVPVDI
jgi:hypothetical protein